MKCLGVLAVAFLTMFSFASYAQDVTDCSLMKDGRFIVEGDEDETAYMVIEDGYMTEFMQSSALYIKSKITWTDDCSYSLELTETNIPNFSQPLGTKLFVKILAVEGNRIKYEYQPSGIIEPGTIIKVSTSGPGSADLAISQVLFF